ncbi:MAG TPA: hypothetical protein VMW42_01450 [Desulfatiglandales bacterium]|nr:hypothetical protein [Desulfatiglandales bacterium]
MIYCIPFYLLLYSTRTLSPVVLMCDYFKGEKFHSLKKVAVRVYELREANKKRRGFKLLKITMICKDVPKREDSNFYDDGFYRTAKPEYEIEEIEIPELTITMKEK